jgi:hypothetical protein
MVSKLQRIFDSRKSITWHGYAVMKQKSSELTIRRSPASGNGNFQPLPTPFSLP